MRNRSGRTAGVTAIAAALGLQWVCVESSWASDASPSEQDSLSEIVVTASKRGESTIHDTPIAVSALSGAELAQTGAIDFQDFYHSIPGLAVQDDGPGDKRYILRGINASGSGTVGLYLDEVIITGENNQDGGGQEPDIKLFDIQRVEVLKGPQGTTFGSSSMAGTIRYITNKPDLENFSGTATEELKSTDGAALGIQTEAAFNLPLVQDHLAVRLSGIYIDLPGYISNRFEYGANNEQSKAGRALIRFDPTDDLTFSGMIMTQTTHQDAKSYYNLVDYAGNPVPASAGWTQDDYARAPWQDNMNIYNLTGSYRQDYGTFTATASRFERDNDFTRDASLAAAALAGLPYNGAGESVLEQPHDRAVDSFEGRFGSTFQGPLQLLLGFFSQQEHRKFSSYWATTNSEGYVESNPTVLLDRTIHTSIDEYAGFGELSYQVTSSLKALVGGRYYDISTNELSSSAPGVYLPGEKFDESGFTPRFNIAYEFTDDLNAYLQAAKGFRAGGTNDQTAVELASVKIPAGYGSDSLWSYEVGMKSRWLDRKLTLNVAAYYIDWSGIQVTAQAYTPAGLAFPYVANGGKAAIKGAEFELGYEPVAGLHLGVSGNYNSPKLTQNNPAPSIGNEGDRIPYVPLWTSAADVEYDIPVSMLNGSVYTGVDWNYTSNRFTDFNKSSVSYFELHPYQLVNARLGFKRDSWSAAFGVTNLANNKAVINIDNVVAGLYPNEYYPTRPRTATFTVTAHF